MLLCRGRMTHRLVKQCRCLLSEHQIFLGCLIDSLATPVARVDRDALLARDLAVVICIFQIGIRANHIHTGSISISIPIHSGHCWITIGARLGNFFYRFVALIMMMLLSSLLRFFATVGKSVCISELSCGIFSSAGQLIFVSTPLECSIHFGMRVWGIEFHFGWGANFRVKTISLVLRLHEGAIMVVRDLGVFWIWNPLANSSLIIILGVEDRSVLGINVLVLVESHVGIVDHCSLAVDVLHFSSFTTVL